MRIKAEGVIRSILFLSILIMVLSRINQILMPKYIYKNSTWPTTSTYNQFYKMMLWSNKAHLAP